ncbi:prolyl oligopeptidase family serine peptidase [Candidatus Woesearchaeota archaeon]|nr:prolyl oligopeptidase family serine peptidase [Candidatus Woesearchaeota archaeon]
MKINYRLLRDYGLCDLINATRHKEIHNPKEFNLEFKKHERILGTQNLWVCFLPWHVNIDIAKSHNLLPEYTDYVAYEIPTGIVNPNPHVTKIVLNSLIEDFEVNYSQRNNIHILGMSLGQYPAIFIANQFDTKKLVVVTPGSKLGACLWDGIATSQVKEHATRLGIGTHQEYDSVLSGTNPIENIRSLPRDLELYIGTNDYYIRKKYGFEFLNALEAQGKNARVRTYQGKGHILTLLSFGVDNNL